jgi:hypothetical protein
MKGSWWFSDESSYYTFIPILSRMLKACRRLRRFILGHRVFIALIYVLEDANGPLIPVTASAAVLIIWRATQEHVLFTVSFLQNCARVRLSLCLVRARGPSEASSGDCLALGATSACRFITGWSKLAGRSRDASSFLGIPLVGASGRFMIGVERCCNRVSHLCSWAIG